MSFHFFMDPSLLDSSGRYQSVQAELIRAFQNTPLELFVNMYDADMGLVAIDDFDFETAARAKEVEGVFISIVMGNPHFNQISPNDLILTLISVICMSAQRAFDDPTVRIMGTGSEMLAPFGKLPDNAVAHYYNRFGLFRGSVEEQMHAYFKNGLEPVYQQMAQNLETLLEVPKNANLQSATERLIARDFTTAGVRRRQALMRRAEWIFSELLAMIQEGPKFHVAKKSYLLGFPSSVRDR